MDWKALSIRNTGRLATHHRTLLYWGESLRIPHVNSSPWESKLGNIPQAPAVRCCRHCGAIIAWAEQLQEPVLPEGLADDPHQAVPSRFVPRRVEALRGADAGVPEEHRDVFHGHAGEQQPDRERVARAVAAEIIDLGIGRNGSQPLPQSLATVAGALFPVRK